MKTQFYFWGSIILVSCLWGISLAQDSQPASMPALEQAVMEYVIDRAIMPPVVDVNGDVWKFDRIVTKASESLSDTEFGAYARLYKSNETGGSLREQAENAYQNLITAHAMQGGAILSLQMEIASDEKRISEKKQKLLKIKQAFDRYGQ